MAILLTGGTGKTSSLLAGMLQQSNTPFVLTVRRDNANIPDGMSAIKFDWNDESTWSNPFQHQFSGGEKITAIYLVAPASYQPYIPMNKFVDLAYEEHNVRRFVLMGGSDVAGEGEHVGKVWQHLLELEGVEYTVLRPNWFMDNFTESFGGAFLPAIKQQRKIFTATGDTKIAFISAVDIARVAYHGLVDKNPHNRDYRLNGPELLTYDEIAAKITEVTGVEVVHVKLSEADRVKNMVELGTPEPYAKILAFIEARPDAISRYDDEDQAVVGDMVKVTGQRPQSFDSFAQKHKAAWV